MHHSEAVLMSRAQGCLAALSARRTIAENTLDSTKMQSKCLIRPLLFSEQHAAVARKRPQSLPKQEQEGLSGLQLAIAVLGVFKSQPKHMNICAKLLFTKIHNQIDSFVSSFRLYMECLLCFEFEMKCPSKLTRQRPFLQAIGANMIKYFIYY